MTENERIKVVRKNLGLTLEKFGSKLGVTKVAISNIEKGKRNVTEQIRKSICREFNINYQWLISGNGDIFKETDDFIIRKIDDIMHGENEFHKNIFNTFAQLDEKELLTLENILDKYVKISNSSNLNSSFSEDAECATQDYLDDLSVEELEEIYKKSVLESASDKKCFASNTTKSTKKASNQ